MAKKKVGAPKKGSQRKQWIATGYEIKKVKALGESEIKAIAYDAVSEAYDRMLRN